MQPIRNAVVTDGKRCLRAVRLLKVLHVAGYRLYGLDGVGKVASAQWIEADDDAAAIAAAAKIMDGKDCELWQGARLVSRVTRDRGR